MKRKSAPQRKCTGCQEMKNKNQLIRIVKIDESSFEVDFTGKKNGRGAYICRSTECLEKAQKSRGLERSFKGKVPQEMYNKLFESLEKEV